MSLRDKKKKKNSNVSVIGKFPYIWLKNRRLWSGNHSLYTLPSQQSCDMSEAFCVNGSVYAECQPSDKKIWSSFLCVTTELELFGHESERFCKEWIMKPWTMLSPVQIFWHNCCHQFFADNDIGMLWSVCQYCEIYIQSKSRISLNLSTFRWRFGTVCRAEVTWSLSIIGLGSLLILLRECTLLAWTPYTVLSFDAVIRCCWTHAIVLSLLYVRVLYSLQGLALQQHLLDGVGNPEQQWQRSERLQRLPAQSLLAEVWLPSHLCPLQKSHVHQSWHGYWRRKVQQPPSHLGLREQRRSWRVGASEHVCLGSYEWRTELLLGHQPTGYCCLCMPLRLICPASRYEHWLAPWMMVTIASAVLQSTRLPVSWFHVWTQFRFS